MRHIKVLNIAYPFVYACKCDLSFTALRPCKCNGRGDSEPPTPLTGAERWIESIPFHSDTKDLTKSALLESF